MKRKRVLKRCEIQHKIDLSRTIERAYADAKNTSNKKGRDIDEKLKDFDEKYSNLVEDVIEKLTVRKVEMNNDNIDAAIKILLTANNYQIFAADNIKDIRNAVLRRINKEKFKDMWER